MNNVQQPALPSGNPPILFPLGSLKRSAEDAAMCLESDCEAEFPHEVFARHQKAEATDSGDGDAGNEADDEATTRGRSRADVEKELDWLRQGCALAFTRASSALRCIEVRTELRIASFQSGPPKLLKQLTRLLENCTWLKNQLIEMVDLGDAVAPLCWGATFGGPPLNPDVPVLDPELTWLETALDVVQSSANQRRHILRAETLHCWDPGEWGYIRRRLTWNTRTLNWLSSARELHAAVTENSDSRVPAG